MSGESVRGELRHPGIVATLIVIGTWWIVAASGVVGGGIVPPPTAAATALVKDGPALFDAVLESLAGASVGYFLGFVIAVVAGMAIGRFVAADRWLSGPLDFFRAIPAVAIVPLALLVMKDGFRVTVFSVAWGCFFLSVINVIVGVKHVPQTLEMAVRSFGGGEATVLRKVAIPSLLPYFLSSLRQNVSIALIVVVVADMIIGLSGLGFYILRAQGNALYDRTYAAIAVVAFVGYAAYRGLERAQKRLFPWWVGSGEPA